MKKLPAQFELSRAAPGAMISKQYAPEKVFVSGCFDMLHGSPVCFLKTTANYGKLHPRAVQIKIRRELLYKVAHLNHG